MVADTATPVSVTESSTSRATYPHCESYLHHTSSLKVLLEAMLNDQYNKASAGHGTEPTPARWPSDAIEWLAIPTFKLDRRFAQCAVDMKDTQLVLNDHILPSQREPSLAALLRVYPRDARVRNLGG